MIMFKYFDLIVVICIKRPNRFKIRLTPRMPAVSASHFSMATFSEIPFEARVLANNNVVAYHFDARTA